jgi:transcriptional regulator with XRE-family HTH domain
MPEVVDRFSRREIARRIERLRKERKLTQSAVAKHLGQTASNVSHLESGWNNQTLWSLLRLSDTFGVHPLHLLAGLSPETCELADYLESLNPERRAAVLRTFTGARELAEGARLWAAAHA